MKLPGVCIGCHAPLVWNGKRWRIPGRGTGVVHVCRVMCGSWMPNSRERCARRPGHTTGHRSPYAMENARHARVMGIAA